MPQNYALVNTLFILHYAREFLDQLCNQGFRGRPFTFDLVGMKLGFVAGIVPCRFD
jgi:hypothetical protein